MGEVIEARLRLFNFMRAGTQSHGGFVPELRGCGN